MNRHILECSFPPILSNQKSTKSKRIHINLEFKKLTLKKINNELTFFLGGGGI